MHDVLAGMDVLGARSVASLKKALPTLEATVAASEAAALDFFQFAFRYCLVVRGSIARAWFCDRAGCSAAGIASTAPLFQYLHPSVYLTDVAMTVSVHGLSCYLHTLRRSQQNCQPWLERMGFVRMHPRPRREQWIGSGRQGRYQLSVPGYMSRDAVLRRTARRSSSRRRRLLRCWASRCRTAR